MTTAAIVAVIGRMRRAGRYLYSPYNPTTAPTIEPRPPITIIAK